MFRKFTRWWRRPLSCKIGQHVCSRGNIGYNIQNQTVDFFCTKCEKWLDRKRLDDSNAVGSVIEIMKMINPEGVEEE